MNPYYHALSSAKTYGGKPEDFQRFHDWFDESKSFWPDIRHRALRHHSEGIFLAERIFGPTITNSEGRVIPTRFLGEQHVKEDLGWIPTVQDWLKYVMVQPWMLKAGTRPPSSHVLEPEGVNDAHRTRTGDGAGRAPLLAESRSATNQHRF